MKKVKSVVIFGGSGFVGSHLALALRDQHKVYATFNRNQIKIPGVTYLPYDLIDRNWMKRAIYNIQPDIVICALGSNDVDFYEQDDTYKKLCNEIHGKGPIEVYSIVDVFQPKFIYLSNSYVFEGLHGNAKEDDTLLPITSLGKAKSNAENYIKGHSMNYVILRSSPLFGRSNGFKKSFFDYMRMTLAKGQTFKIKNDEIHSFAAIQGLTEIVSKVIDGNIKNKVFHYNGLNKMTHYDFAIKFAKHFSYDSKCILPANPSPWQSDSNKSHSTKIDFSLNSTKTLNELQIKPFLLEESFDLLKQQLIPSF